MEQPKTPAVRGVRTFCQTVGGLFVGLVAAVWNVPGVPDAVHGYVVGNFVPLLVASAGFVGIPAGLIAFAQHRLANK